MAFQETRVFRAMPRKREGKEGGEGGSGAQTLCCSLFT